MSTNQDKTKAAERTQDWQDLANNAIADALDWKRKAREAQAQRDELLAACKRLLASNTAVIPIAIENVMRDAIAKAEGSK